MPPQPSATSIPPADLTSLVQTHDWSAAGIGAIQDWPPSLTAAVDIVLASPTPMGILWGERGILLYNDSYAAFAGHRHPGMLGLPAAEGWPEAAELNRRILSAGRSGATLTVKNHPLSLATADARPGSVWLDLSCSPIPDSTGRAAGVLAIVRDVTQHALAERQREAVEKSLREREAELARVQRIGRVGGLQVDLRSGFRNHRSPEYLLLHGLPPSAANETHEDWVRRVHPDDRSRTEQQFLSAINSDMSDYTAEYRIIRPSDSALRWIAVNAVIERDADGKAIRLLGAHTDITERKQAELALQQMNESLEAMVQERTRELHAAEESLRLAKKMEAIGQLTRGIAHDFNNLLTGITGGLDIVRRRLASGRLDDIDRFIEAATTSAKRAADLTQRLLAFSRQQLLDLKPIALEELLRSMQDMFRVTLREGIDLKLDLAPGLWTIEGDKVQIESALLNLVANAADAMPDGGVITISASNSGAEKREHHFLDGPDDGDDCVRISVTDTGMGMSSDVLDRAFDPFFTTKPIGKGTGLGLSMVYGYAKQTRGHVHIESIPGKGTSVDLYLRRHAVPADQSSEPLIKASEPRATGHAAMLVVEDDPAVRQLVVEVLGAAGYAVIEAADGSAALPILKSERQIDLLVSDIGLPGLDGRRIAEFGRRWRPDLKVLFLTGYAQHAESRSEFLGPGMDLIAKPFSVDHLAERIREMIGR